jgi:hypothetical protein
MIGAATQRQQPRKVIASSRLRYSALASQSPARCTQAEHTEHDGAGKRNGGHHADLVIAATGGLVQADFEHLIAGKPAQRNRSRLDVECLIRHTVQAFVCSRGISHQGVAFI